MWIKLIWIVYNWFHVFDQGSCYHCLWLTYQSNHLGTLRRCPVFKITMKFHIMVVEDQTNFPASIRSLINDSHAAIAQPITHQKCRSRIFNVICFYFWANFLKYKNISIFSHQLSNCNVFFLHNLPQIRKCFPLLTSVVWSFLIQEC
jgi:hypothetical protein